jgi:hypothetical protein
MRLEVHGLVSILKGNVLDMGVKVEVNLRIEYLSIPLIIGLCSVLGKDDGLT